MNTLVRLIIVISAVLATTHASLAGSYRAGPSIYSGGQFRTPDGQMWPFTWQNGVGWSGGGVSAAGPIVAQLTWDPDFFGDEPPPAVVIEEYCFARGVSMSNQPEPTADNGLGHPETKYEKPIAPGVKQNFADSIGYRTTQVVTGGSWNLIVQADPRASGSIQASVNYWVRVTPLAVQVDMYPTYYKGELNGPVPNNDPPPFQPTPRFADVGIGDMDIVFVDDTAFFGGEFVFTRTLIGDSWVDPYHVWTTPTSTFRDTWLFEWDRISEVFAFDDLQLENMALKPKVKHIRLRVENNGGAGAKVEADYYVRFHNKYSNWVVDSTWQTWEECRGLTVEPPGRAEYGGGVMVTWQTTPVFWNNMVLAGEATSAVSAALVTNPIYAVAFTLINVGLSSLEPETGTQVVSFNDHWGTPNSVIINGSWSDDPSRFFMVPGRFELYNYYNQICDFYDRFGYFGQAGDTKSKFAGGVLWNGVFQRYADVPRT